jgi:hypothetical protein
MRLACDLPDSKIGLFPQGHFMRISSHVLPGPSQKNPLIVLGVIGLIVLLAYELAQYVIAGDFVGLSYIGLSVMVGAAMLTMLNNWRAGTFIFFAWLFFEDFARKYLGNNMAIYFGKDVLVAVIYLSYFIAYRRKQVRTFRPPFLIPLLLFVWFGVIQVFNPASTSFFFGILGLKLYFYYIPLLFIGYSIIQTEEDLRRFYPFLMLLTVIVAGLGIAQAILGHTFLNPAVMQEEIRELSANYRTAPISGVIVYRPTSVFVSAGRFAFFLVPAFLFAFGYGAYLLLRSKERRLFTLLTLAVTTSAIALCASRGTLLWTAGSIIVCVPAFLWGCPWQKGQLLRVFRGFQRAALAGVAALLLTLVFYPDALKNRFLFYWETLDPSSTNSELLHRTQTYPLQQLGFAFDYPRWPYGYGIGTASLGTQYISRILHIPPVGIGVESGFGALVLELGIVGLLLYLISAAAIVVSAWSAVVKLKGTPWFPIGFVIFWYAFLFLFPYVWGGFQSFEDFILNALLWFSLGILFRLPSLPLNGKTLPAMQQQTPNHRLA